MGQAANLYEDPVNVENVFSTYLYDGTGSAQTITNNVDLTEGGLVWLKHRSSSSFSAADHWLIDTERGGTKYLNSNDTGAEAGNQNYISAFNSNGFTLGTSDAEINFGSGNSEYASWTFRKAPKFFDVIAYEGNGQTSQTISHSLGSKPGMMIVKRTDGTGIWWVYHRDLGATKYLKLQSYETFGTGSGVWNNTEPTSTEFTVGNDSEINYSNRTYVAYLFAHNEGDGGFGLTKDQDIIKCGSYTVPSTAVFDVELGFEPQFLIVKATGEGGSLNQYYDWFMFDSMRGLNADNLSTGLLVANETTSEASNPYHNGSYDLIQPTSTGFKVTGAPSGAAATASNGYTYAYMAIRRPMATPTSATDVFAMDTMANQTPAFDSGFPVDMAIRRNLDFATSNALWSRLTGQKYMNTDSSAVESNDSESFDHMDGWGDGSTYSGNQAWMWKRAPGYFDVVAYSGTGSARTVSHNLGVVPEMMWVKSRSKIEDWSVYHAGITNPEQNYLYLNNTGAVNQNANTIKYWNHTNPTSSVFSVGDESRVNASGHTYIAYLFATVAGISKVGSVSHSFNSTTNVDCGFSSGARFVLVKSTATGDWYVWDSLRGIVTGNDPYFTLNTSSAEVTNGDLIDPYSGGFALSPGFYTDTYIFYAIA